MNAGFARLSQEVYQNVHKLNAYNKDQVTLTREMLQQTISDFNERCDQLSRAHFVQKLNCKRECQKQVAEEVKNALATEENLPLANALATQIQELREKFNKYEVRLRFTKISP